MGVAGAPPGRETMASWMRRAARWARLVQLSFIMMWAMWRLTVATEMPSVLAIWGLVRPWTKSWPISSSRGRRSRRFMMLPIGWASRKWGGDSPNGLLTFVGANGLNRKCKSIVRAVRISWDRRGGAMGIENDTSDESERECVVRLVHPAYSIGLIGRPCGRSVGRSAGLRERGDDAAGCEGGRR